MDTFELVCGFPGLPDVPYHRHLNRLTSPIRVFEIYQRT